MEIEGDIHFTKIQLNDISVIQKLALENNGNISFNEKNFTHWYINNPIQSSSLWKVEANNSIEGYATTNNFPYILNGKELLVSLPQNVLVSEKFRGKGLFGKLYYATEKENLEENKVDLFLTSTNAISTPIFLSKFDYHKAVCPPIIINPFSLRLFFAKTNHQIVVDINSVILNHFTLNNSRKKNLDYFKWRYSNVTKNKLNIISIIENNTIIGIAFLITKKIKGIKALILADIICEKEEDYPKVIRESRIFASKNFYFSLIYFQLNIHGNNQRTNIKIKNWFNFLVKGKNTEETINFSKIHINYFFGDLDFFW